MLVRAQSNDRRPRRLQRKIKSHPPTGAVTKLEPLPNRKIPRRKRVTSGARAKTSVRRRTINGLRQRGTTPRGGALNRVASVWLKRAARPNDAGVKRRS